MLDDELDPADEIDYITVPTFNIVEEKFKKENIRNTKLCVVLNWLKELKLQVKDKTLSTPIDIVDFEIEGDKIIFITDYCGT